MKWNNLAVLGAAATAYAAPQADRAPDESAPEGCQTSYDGSFSISVVKEPAGESSNTKRATGTCAEGSLVITLQDGVLKDSQDRTGNIVANYQFQFDKPLQDNAIYTRGFSVCSNGKLAIGANTTFYQCLSGDFYNLYDRDWAEHCEPISIVASPCSGSSGSGGSEGSASQVPDGQVQAPSAPVSQIGDGQVQAPTGAPVSQIGDGQVQAPTGAPVTQISDGQVQAPTGAPVSQISDGQVQAPTGAPVSQISDGQVQAPTGAPVSQISDGQVQAPTGAPVSQISDGQVQAPTGVPVSQISDGQVQAPTGAPISQISDGQIQAPTGAPISQISDGQIQAPTGAPISQISDGQVQAPASTLATLPTGPATPIVTPIPTPIPTGGALKMMPGTSVGLFIAALGAVLML